MEEDKKVKFSFQGKVTILEIRLSRISKESEYCGLIFENLLIF